MKLFLVLFALLFVELSIAQTQVIIKDKTYKENRFYVTGGLLCAINADASSSNFGSRPNNNSNFWSWNATAYYSRMASNNFMFQTGIEYAPTQYYIAYLSYHTYTNFGSDYYNMTFNINTISLPAYFNLLLNKRKLFVGLGTCIDVSPSYYKGNQVYNGYNNNGFYTAYSAISGSNNLISLVNIGVASKIGYFISIKKQLFTIETKFKYSLFSSFNKNNTDARLHISYFTLNIGYVFKK